MNNRITASLVAIAAGLSLVGAGRAGAVPLIKYAPEGPSNGTTVLLVHGGAWGAGGADVWERDGQVGALTAAGYRVVSADYADKDLPTAVRQVKGVANALARGHRKVVVWGVSAGGQLALMAAAEGARVTGVVASAAPSDLRSLRRTLERDYVPKGYVRRVLKGQGAWRWSPLRAAKAGRFRVPVLLTARRGDPVVSFTGQVVPLYRALKQHAKDRTAVRLLPLGGTAHDYQQDATSQVVAWIS